jgi:hypothetical protein
MSKIRNHAIACATLLAGVLPVAAQAGASAGGVPETRDPVAATTVKGACIADKIAFASSSAQQSTDSQTAVNLTGAVVKPNVTASCLAVDFTAVSFAAKNGELLYVQVLLDGTAMSPGEIQLSGNDDPVTFAAWARAHAFTFVATNVAAGQHTIQVQYGSRSGNIVFINDYTLVAHYH